ncbi:MAG: Nif3-like dinuclear metal center hexameric protein [Chitinispirillaceae bacterium]|nr:Nif3-like dinuclear metal center hexameric protein [Chitinispirillaceae bacterium]
MKNKKRRMAARDALVSFLDRELSIASIDDFSRNGLQVQGAEKISSVGLAVDACLEAYQAAARNRCQMIVVHHGLIWGGLPYITKETFTQLKFLFDHGINLYAAHLPLDLHPKLGNNAQIAKMLGIRTLKPFGRYKGTAIGYEGLLPKPLALAALSAQLERYLGGTNIVVPFGPATVRRVAVVSGSASEIIDEAILKGVDCFITGEPKHPHHHLAREAGLNVIYCGHYHSEKPGVMAVGELITKKFGIQCTFLDIPTLV